MKTDLTPARERRLAAACHWSMLLSGFIGPLVIWLTKKDASSLVDKNGREALNFILSMISYLSISVVLVAVTVGAYLFYVLLLLFAVLTIIASVRISGGVSYRYPFVFRFIPR